MKSKCFAIAEQVRCEQIYKDLGGFENLRGLFLHLLHRELDLVHRARVILVTLLLRHLEI